VDAIAMDPETGYPVVCIHCGRYVPFCPHSCLELVDKKKEVAYGDR
jgi:ferredoxin